MANMLNLPNEPARQADEDPDGPSTAVSKPIGDAIPTPVEPGLDQSLPEKGETRVSKEGGADENKDNPIGATDTPPGVPAPGPSDFE